MALHYCTGEKEPQLRAVFVGGTWSRRGQKTDGWLMPGSSFSTLLNYRGIRRVHDDRIWSTVEDGLIAEDIVARLRGKPIDGAWRKGAYRLANLLSKNDDVDLLISHSHGAQVVALAAHLVRTEMSGIRWLAIDPPVRRERLIHWGYEEMAKLSPRIVQTISSTWNFRSWPRWAGARRLPWDRKHLPGAIAYDQPSGHSEVLRWPYSNDTWWDSVIHAVKS